uniref:Cathepsin L-like cysteine protease 2 n=1 Tax=Plautia stali TaxID=106108 RepID=A9CPH2_PLAST|nr:cathepsin L-like cysteine protease 2 [Plautia stali]
MQGLLVLSCLIALGQAVSFFDLSADEFTLFKKFHRKEYDNELEESYRKKIFLENKKRIEKHNSRYKQGKVSFKLKLNHLADMLIHEYSDVYLGFNKSSKANNNKLQSYTFIPPAHVTLNKEVDWRTKGAVTPVKNQGHCGSCWAFSTTGALEGQNFRKTGKLVSLSEQNLVDCSGSYGNNGCEGGLMDNAFQYIKENHGIDTEKSYPYEGEDETCRFRKTSIGATDSGFVDITQGDEEALMQAVATIGPISVAIDASHQSFQFYSEGVYYEPECSSENLDHGVLVVGYGVEDNQKYWLVKNSWGTQWGDGGYIKMARDQDNNCGIATQASYPLV